MKKKRFRLEAGRVRRHGYKRWRVADHREPAIIAGAVMALEAANPGARKAPAACIKRQVIRRVNTNTLPSLYRFEIYPKNILGGAIDSSQIA
ncbi:hypothetical protein [Polaromonas sp. YR568]|uniref:hypothetical protein n=1 Tax=Polaromonas sp. YR568 TaxID=1855301 RepID=UPI0011134023|nr:hypothetical protein [Polaromonas sp. YR568]